MDKDLILVRDELLFRRANFHAKKEPPAVNAAFMELRRYANALQETLSPEQAVLCRKMENAYHLSDGESGRFFYSAGMQDTLSLLFDRGCTHHES